MSHSATGGLRLLFIAVLVPLEEENAAASSG